MTESTQASQDPGFIACTNCRRAYPETGTPYRCPACGGIFDYVALPAFDPSLVKNMQPGIWRYWHALGLADTAPQVTIGEGHTPLVWRHVFGRQVAFKLEFLNPSGSYKDRGSAVLVSFLRSRGVEEAVEDSSGNAGASLAAYAATAGMRARLFVPETASGPKRFQIEAYGAEVVSVPGPRSNAAKAVQRAAQTGATYASHAYLPQVQSGYATLAYEALQQMGEAPGAVITPAGQGNLMLSIGRAFASMLKSGLLERLPVMVGVQALACAPLWALYNYGAEGLQSVNEGETLAEGVRVRFPVRSDAVMKMLTGKMEGHPGSDRSGDRQAGMLVAVGEPDIIPGCQALAKLGFYVEPTSAIVWNALEQVINQLPDPILVVLTGSGLKAPDVSRPLRPV